MLMMLMLLLLLDLELIGTAQAIEESDGSDDEWNYIKVEDKKEELDTVPQESVEEHTQQYQQQEEQQEKDEIIESSIVEEEKLVEEEEEVTAPIEAVSEQLEENVSIFKFMAVFCVVL